MVSATAVVTDNSTMVTVKLPKEFNVDFSKDKELEWYLSDIIFDALLDYREIKQDAELKEKLSKNGRFQSLNKQMEEAVWRI